MDKHINFFELEKACREDGCPLCRIVNDRATRYIDNMLFEHVSDRVFRAKHREAGGFCARHAQGMASFRDGLAVAIMGRDILEDRIKSFEHVRPWKPKGQCPICEEQDRIEEEYLSFLAEADGNTEDERELRDVFCASSGLCAPHYAKLLFGPKGRPRRFPAWLRTFQEEHFRKLYQRVSDFIEFSAYGREADFNGLSEADKLVWKELAKTLNGAG